MEQKLFWDAWGGDVAEVRRIIRESPWVDVNTRNQNVDGWTALHAACRDGHDRLVALLLTHPAIEVNQKKNDGETPFAVACSYQSSACVRQLLKDPRVDPNDPDYQGDSPLWGAVRTGNVEAVRWWIASGRRMELGHPGPERNDVIAMAKRLNRPALLSLLEMIRDRPGLARHRIRLELGWYGEAAAEVFALIVFYCDGLLEMRSGGRGRDPETARFFRVAALLPMELQAVLAYRVVGSAATNLTGEAREAAFRSLAWKL